MLKKKLREHLEKLSKMTVAEYHRYQAKQPIPEIKIDDYKQMVPQVFPCVDDSWEKYCTEPYSVHGGRAMHFLVVDRGKSIGAILLKNDTVNLKPRDEFIGWTDRARLPFIVRATLMSPDPNLLELFGRIALSRQCLLPWNNSYSGQHVVGVVTTSFQDEYKYWTLCGEYEQEVQVIPNEEVANKCVEWMKEKHPTKNPNEIFDLFQIELPKIKHKRKVWFCDLYKDALPFLRQDKETIIAQPTFSQRMPDLVQEWKDGL